MWLMTSKKRIYTLALLVPIIAFIVIGGFFSQAMTRDDTFRHLAVFNDVVSIVLKNYVEEVDITPAVEGAMRGLSEALDSDSAYLTQELVQSIIVKDSLGKAEIGLDVIRQYYLRVVSALDGSPAARAGLKPGDYVRFIDGKATRHMASLEGMQLLQGAPGTTVELLVFRGNANESHTVDLIREELENATIQSRIASTGVGYIRIPEFRKDTPVLLQENFQELSKAGAKNFIVDLRGTSRGDFDYGIAAARLFVKSGTLTIQQFRERDNEVISSDMSDGNLAAPVILLINSGTSGAAEIFAAALNHNDRASLIGQQSLGRVAQQKLVALPDGSGLWISYLRYLMPNGDQLHERGLTPDIEIEEPDLEFGETPLKDSVLEKAIEQSTEVQLAA